MTTAKPLRKKQAKEIVQTIKDQFNINFPIDDYHFFLNTKNKVFILKQSEHILSTNLEFLRTDRMGLYFAEYKNGFFRPSMQGAQLLMQIAKQNKTLVKNTLELSKTETNAFFAGVDLKLPDQPDSNALILTYQGNALGFAQIKEGKLFNYLPKTFRGTTIV